MKTLEQAHQEFNYEQLIREQLVGQPNAINAYIECCQRYVGQQKIALIWEGKMVSLRNGVLNSSMLPQLRWQIILKVLGFKWVTVSQGCYRVRLNC